MSKVTDRPRLMFFTKTFVETSQVWLYRQATLMDKFDVHVVTWDRINEDQFDVSGLTIHRINGEREPNDGPQRFKIRFLNAWKRNFYAARGSEVTQIKELIDEIKPAAAFCSFGAIGLRVISIAVEAGIPLVVHFNGVDLSGSLRSHWYRRSLAWQANRFAHVIGVGEHHRRRMSELGLEDEKFSNIPYGVPRVNNRPSADKYTVCKCLMVGRLVDKKSPHSSLRAFAACLQKHPDLRLTIIGDGPLLESCRVLAVELNIDHALDWRGACSAEVVRQAMVDHCVFLQHSVTPTGGDQEGWPVAIAEAASHGMVVVSTRHASIPEQILDGETGLLTDEHDWKGMAAHLDRLARSEQLRRQLGNAAYEHLLNFDVVSQVGKLQDVLLSVANHNTAAV